MKKFKYIIISIFILGVALCFTGIMLGADVFVYVSNNGVEIHNEDVIPNTQRINFNEKITNIGINLNGCKINVVESDKFGILINDHTLEYSVEDNKLSVFEKGLTNDIRFYVGPLVGLNVGINNKPNLPKVAQTTVTLYLPSETKLNEFLINGNACDIKIDTINSDIINIKNSYDDISLNNITANKLNVFSTSGDVMLDNVITETIDLANEYDTSTLTNITTDNLNISSTNGEVSLDYIDAEIIKLTNAYADVTCNNITANALKATVNNGELDVSGKILGDIYIENSYDEISLNLDGNIEKYNLDLSTQYENIHLNGKEVENTIIDNNANYNVKIIGENSAIVLNFNG